MLLLWLKSVKIMTLSWLLGRTVLSRWPVFDSQPFFRRKITQNSFEYSHILKCRSDAALRDLALDP